MTLNELIDLLRRQRAAHPELADQPALVVLDVGECDGDSYESYVPAIDVWASTRGVVVAPRVMRGTSPQAPACDDEYVHRYENSQITARAVAQPVHSLRDCELELTALVPTYAQAQDGLTFDCSCGRRFAHVCDEAEGCRWDVIRGPRPLREDVLKRTS